MRGVQSGQVEGVDSDVADIGHCRLAKGAAPVATLKGRNRQDLARMARGPKRVPALQEAPTSIGTPMKQASGRKAATGRRIIVGKTTKPRHLIATKGFVGRRAIRTLQTSGLARRCRCRTNPSRSGLIFWLAGGGLVAVGSATKSSMSALHDTLAADAPPRLRPQ